MTFAVLLPLLSLADPATRASLARATKLVSSWPPPRASPEHLWLDGISSGPLGRSVDAVLQQQFRRALVTELGRDVPQRGYSGVMRLCQDVVVERGSAVKDASCRVLTSLFPDWPPGAPAGRLGLLYWFEVFFAKPFPAFSAKLNAWVTWWAAQWLMGPCSLVDLDDETEHLGDGDGQLLLVHRCRFLEEAACASVCVNVCKMPTQAFFNEEMGVPMRMEPDYETLECRFKFGVPPTAADEADARAVACFAACPSAGSLRAACHKMGSMEADNPHTPTAR